MAGIGSSVIDELYLKLAEDKKGKKHRSRGPSNHGEYVTKRGNDQKTEFDFRERIVSNDNGNMMFRGRYRGREPERNISSSHPNASSDKFLPHQRDTTNVGIVAVANQQKNSSRMMQSRHRSLNRRLPLNTGGTEYEINNSSGHNYNKRSLSSQPRNGRSVENVHESYRQPGRKLGYMRLQALCNETPTEIVTTLVKSNSGFEELLSSELNPDFVILVVTLLAKACACDFGANKAALLNIACQTKLLDSIERHMFKMPSDDSPKRRELMGTFILNLFVFYEAVMNVLPNTASEKFKKLFISADLMMNGVAAYQKINLSEQKEKFCALERQLQNIIEERETKKIKITSRDEHLKYAIPPGDFREMGLYPSLEDLFGDVTPFVRPNIVDGAYIDVEHYLDIQFRLLREDFVSPLRDGLRKLRVETLDTKRRHRIENVRVYRNVKFGNPKVINDAVGIVVHFDPKNKLNIKWEYSKRFMFGSLLLFTNDNFKHVIFGTVLERDMKYLNKGEISVALLQEDHGLKIFGSDFLMVESEVYFEPYKYVMKALQAFEESSFPMKKYIVSVQKEVDPPKYLLLLPNYYFRMEYFKIQVLNESAWSLGNSLGLDKSQLLAFKAALTEEFVIIQGPPGTGKTYLGLRIAKILLRNFPIWNTSNTPILVVCYTNHALDQFLEGLVQDTCKIVRVGGQSKSPVLSKYNLREKRRDFHFRNANTHLKREYHASMSKLMLDIKKRQANLEELERHKGVVSVGTLVAEKIISPQHQLTFDGQEYSEDRIIQDWLLEESEDWYVEEKPGDPVKSNVINEMNMQDEEEEEVEGAWLTADHDPVFFDLGDVTHDLEYAVDLQMLENRQEELLTLSQHLKENPTPHSEYRLEEMGEEFFYLKHVFEYWNASLTKSHQANDTNMKRLHSTLNLWQLSVEDRWTLYKDWVNTLKNKLRNSIHKLQKQYQDYSQRHEEMKHICDIEIMQNSLIVGMTTTNAARLQMLLQALKPKIVIVEEAAEVLESHIVVSLSNKCEHVILIGDHQQLRPNLAVYKLARDYNFDISLFERMIKNGMQCYTLEKQHRMRPEIASLIVPSIYPDLKNDESVYNYPAVRGITKSLFFITHDVPEEEDTEIMSHKNKHEADFILTLCRHLIWQGYQPSEITVLATYKGQMFYMRKKQKAMESLRDVNITVVDNYQGEENKIILLSLVRSNEIAKIGFLRIENRVCVALSRAREGLYIVGNMDNLVQSSTIWPKIKESLVKQNCYGTHLTLQCQIHPDQLTMVNCAEHFKKLPEGGCSLLCKAPLECGHQCESICHVNNRDHKVYKCYKKCQRIPEECPVDHPCPKLCHETCGKCETYVERILPCGHLKNLHCYINVKEYLCVEKIEVVLPHCGHKVLKPCHRDTSTYPCPVTCQDRLPCGHSCTLKCHVLKDPDHLEYKCEKVCAKTNAGCTMNHNCTKLCYEECGLCCYEVSKELPYCDHSLNMKCSQDPGEVECKKNCSKTMMCGHKCPRKCYETCGGCQQKVQKVISSCGHEVKIKCCKVPIPSLCKHPCERLLPCGHRCFIRCGQECAKKCLERVVYPGIPLCGHSIKVSCYLQRSIDPKSQQLLRFCEVPCGQILHCGHQCQGTCGGCMQGRIHIACAEKCDRNLICSHKCKYPCAESCPPCSAKCEYRCKHSKCPKKCGVPCQPCKEPCAWKCEHLRCSKLCHELCDRKPCYEPCKKQLKCDHDCIGFCGDTCPTLCRICNADVVKEVFLGEEDRDNARFVCLVDCQHTLESEGLERWLQLSDTEIVLKTCPRCRTPIMHTERFMNNVKQVFRDVAKVKTKQFGERNILERDRNKLLDSLTSMNSKARGMQFMFHNKMCAEMFQMCREQLQPVRNQRINYLSRRDLQSIKSQIQIFEDLLNSIFEYIIKPKIQLKQGARTRLFDHFDSILEKIKEHHGKLNTQGTMDFNRECKRFLLSTQLAVMESSSNFTFSQTQKTGLALYREACSVLDSIEIFTDLKYAKLKEILETFKHVLGDISIVSDRERKEIVHAIGLQQGHWFKCPNGHIYCIGECGGAMQTSKCPECGEAIGGSNHHLLQSNRLASEMDGAQRHAFPGGLY